MYTYIIIIMIKDINQSTELKWMAVAMEHEGKSNGKRAVRLLLFFSTLRFRLRWEGLIWLRSDFVYVSISKGRVGIPKKGRHNTMGEPGNIWPLPRTGSRSYRRSYSFLQPCAIWYTYTHTHIHLIHIYTYMCVCMYKYMYAILCFVVVVCWTRI